MAIEERWREEARTKKVLSVPLRGRSIVSWLRLQAGQTDWI